MELIMERKPFIAAYLFDRGAEPGSPGAAPAVSPEDAKILDRINWAFGLCIDGAVSGAHWVNPGQLTDLKAANPHLKTILSVGGWGSGGYSDALLTPAGRERFAQSAVELMLRYDFDGVDLDWEYPTIGDAGIDARPEDKWTFTKMMWLLRAKMDALTLVTGRSYHLSMAVGCGTERYAHIMELAELGSFLDEINLMSYDMRQGTSETTGHHTNLYNNKGDPRPASADFAVNLFIEHGVPVEKLVIGAAFYGRGWTGVQGGGTGLHAKSSKWEYRAHGGYAQLGDPAWQAENGFTRYWDDEAKAPYLFNGDIFISYDDPESVAHKIKYCKQRNMKGLMYWEYGGDPTGAMLRAMEAARL
jgi:chitinase